MEDNSRTLLIARLAIGLAQGIGLYLISEASKHGTPSISQDALTLVFSFAPIILIQGLGTVRLPVLSAWAAVAAIIAAGLGAYAGWRGEGVPHGYIIWGDMAGLHLFAFAFFFIGQALVTGTDIDRRVMALYPTHFDVAWKLCLQLILVFFFTVALWLMLWLGALLFQLIGLSFLRTLITDRLFVFTASALTTAGGLHLTDVQPGLVRGMRGLVLTLFSWLLLLMTLLATGFLAALLFTGLTPLWHMKYASADLLTAAALLIVLINAMLQDMEKPAPMILARAGQVASLALLPLVVLSAYAINLRVGQYGWTGARVAVVACLVVAGFYAVGYAVSVFHRKLLPRWNFAASLLILAVIAALFSPLADPARIAVASQAGRVASGAVSPDKFDFNFLRNNGQRFGQDALKQLAQNSNPAIAGRARQALNGRFISPFQRPGFNLAPVAGATPQQIAAQVTVWPKGKSLPASFLTQHWTQDDGARGVTLRCTEPTAFVHTQCDALVADLDGDGHDEIILMNIMTPGAPIPFFNAQLLRQQADGRWHFEANLGFAHCKGDLDALRDGKVKMVPPEHPDMMLGNHRIVLNWPARNDCPAH